MAAEACILIPTFSRQAPLARWTGGMIEREWSNHPKIAYCGANAQDPLWLPLRSDPTDWLEILRAAVEDLARDGVEFLYLILDDQFPMGRCNDLLLNSDYLQWMTEEGVDRIALFGAGQYQLMEGTLMTFHGLPFEVPSNDCPWLFSLHPALWRVSSLGAHLEEVCRRASQETITAWEYEALCREGLRDSKLTRFKHLRVVGAAHAHVGCGRGLFRLCSFLGGCVRSIRRLLGSAGVKRLEETIERLAHPFSKYYHGPYPYYWSGALLRGRLQSDLVAWLKLSARWEMLRGLRRATAFCG